MRRVLMSPGWLARHLALVVFLALFAFLGRWQWDVSRGATGSLQNTLYAFQWWSFGVAFVYGWWRMVQEELQGSRAARGAAPPPVPVRFDEDDWVGATLQRHGLLAPPEDATDAERAAYLAHLAELYARDQAGAAAPSPAS